MTVPELRYVQGDTVEIRRAPGGSHLRVCLEDRCVLAAKFKRVFPLTVPSDYLSIQAADGEEVAILTNLEKLDSESRAIVDESLDLRYYTPVISLIEKLRLEAGMWHFEVQTQRGRTEFYVRNWRDNAQEIAPGRWQIYSVDGARYEIHDLEKLDHGSRRLMDQLL